MSGAGARSHPTRKRPVGESVVKLRGSDSLGPNNWLSDCSLEQKLQRQRCSFEEVKKPLRVKEKKYMMLYPARHSNTLTCGGYERGFGMQEYSGQTRDPCENTHSLSYTTEKPKCPVMEQ
ncbi:hypothetical protein NDU88_002084 [Pleurodeles waltl]|uniref:Uncharacterized protein n=1 Tax=Pleurodeles waltl TaxID=8319 RepID=A0AAV7VBH8_PLEWA|nr:hypothetical protein NDU88_002084 [Pleurodeles waltl]